MVRLASGASVVLGLAMVALAVPALGQDAPQPSVEPSAAPSADASVIPSMAASPAPSLPEMPEAVVKVESDVPLFAGPADLKVSGEVGRYRWEAVSFGAQEVKSKVVLVPDEEPCVMRLRLTEDGRQVAHEAFAALAHEKATHRSVIDVDYATAKLKVDSDCAAWSLRFEPIDDPKLRLAIEERFYPVRGDSVAELAEGTQRIDGTWAAFADWHTSWSYRWIDNGASCQTVSGDTRVAVKLKMPRWRKPGRVDPAVAREWRRVYENLLRHELGHVTIALQGADAIDDRLDSGFRAKSCKQVARRADAAASRILDHYSRASDRYDRDTDHGRSQGAWFR